MQNETTAKAELLNDFFSSVFTREDDTDIPVLKSMCDTKLLDIVVHEDTIKTRLLNLKDDKAAGDDNLSPRILNAVSDESSYPVAVIFRRSLDTGCVPRDWRTANVTVTLIFKKGNRHQTSNCRPVSLTSQICKVVESIIRDHLVQHLVYNNLINNSQHGFCKGYSCSTNLLVFLETVIAEIDSKHNVDAVYLDLAFDNVPHRQLMLKLKAHGIDGLLGDWIKSWLTDRWQ